MNRRLLDSISAARGFLTIGVCAPMQFLLGCGIGIQSALDPAGIGAARVAELLWWMAAGAVLIWLAVVGLAIAAVRNRGQRRRSAALMIIGGGAVIPTLVLAGLLVYGLRMLPDLLAPAPQGAVRIVVTGEQWWWRVQYHVPGVEPFELANEIHLPVGEPVQFELLAADVIHSFWIPSLGGKMDMIPGRRTRLKLEPTRTGIFRGTCAEYCGTSHALMALVAVVEERREFEAWVRQQSSAAQPPESEVAGRGAHLFLANGCGACHTVRGTPADGAIGPELTHVGSRRSLGSAILPNQPDAFARWIQHPDSIKPGVQMPNFEMLPEEDVRAIAAYLESLN